MEKLTALTRPAVRLVGDVNEGMLLRFLEQFDSAGEGEVVVEVTSHGGDADVGARIAEEIRLATESGRVRPISWGKTVVYSAAVTIMSAFPPERRILSRNTTLLIHERRLERQVQLSGPLRSQVQILEEWLAELRDGMRRQQLAFDALVQGTDVTPDEVAQRARAAWYVSAEEALARRLVAQIV